MYIDARTVKSNIPWDETEEKDVIVGGKVEWIKATISQDQRNPLRIRAEVNIFIL